MILQRLRPGWWFDAALLVGFAALTTALAFGALLRVDLEVAHWADAHRPPVAYWAARGLLLFGQGGLVTWGSLALTAWLVWRYRSVRPGLVWLVGYIINYLAVGPLKFWFHRGAPHDPAPISAVELFSRDPFLGAAGRSYPSGHVVNTIVWYAVIVALLAPHLSPLVRRLLRWVPPVFVSVATTYLAFHWLTDTFAGLAVGLLLGRVVDRIPWRTVPLPRWLAGWDKREWTVHH